jgi:hypothetical protein
VGTHLDSVNLVSFGAVSARSFTIVSDSLIWAVVGTGASGYVRVSSAAGTDSLGGFVFIPAPPSNAPHIALFFPDTATINDQVRIVGVHFDSVFAVSFGGVSARSFTIVSDSLIIAVVGNGATGRVKVSSPAGIDSLGGFIFAPALPTAPPAISSFTPTSGTSGTVVTIHGAHFRGTTLVRFGGTSAASFSVLSDSVVSAVVGTGSSGPIKMTNARGTGVSSGSFNYRHAHSNLTVYPNPVTGGTMTVLVPETTTQSKFLLTDASGHTVLTIPVGAGVKQMVIPVSRFNKGVYKLVWSDGQSTASQTILLIQ